MQDLKQLLAEKQNTLLLSGFDPVSAHGFTQVPNVILEDPSLSLGAKMCYAMLLRYAWQKESCFPGQESLAQGLGISKRSVVTFLKELESSGYVEKMRRGLGKTNVYVLHCRVVRKRKTTRREVQNLHL
jgi:hypothetical protein